MAHAVTTLILRNNPFSRTRHFSSNSFRIVEVGVRDGLQNEKTFVPTETKLELIRRLAACGLKTIEATSFVSPKWVPQMKDHSEIVAKLPKDSDVMYPVLVPNMAGLEAANRTGCVKEIALFVGASDSFNRKNVNCSTDECLSRAIGVAKEAQKHGLRIRGYISTVIGCPYEGDIAPKKVSPIAAALLENGCYEISLGDTIGVGTPGSVKRLLDELAPAVPVEKLAVHFHDTYGQALSNVLVAVENGIRVADSSVAGLGGCPYANGATGNVASEDLVYMLSGMGFNTNVDLNKLVDTSEWICEVMDRKNSSRVATAILNKRRKN